MLILLNKGLKDKARIPTDDLMHQNRRCRNQHSMVFQIPSAKIVLTPINLASFPKLSGTEMTSLILLLSDDSVSKFTSLVRARDLSSSDKPW